MNGIWKTSAQLKKVRLLRRRKNRLLQYRLPDFSHHGVLFLSSATPLLCLGFLLILTCSLSKSL